MSSKTDASFSAFMYHTFKYISSRNALCNSVTVRLLTLICLAPLLGITASRVVILAYTTPCKDQLADRL